MKTFFTFLFCLVISTAFSQKADSIIIGFGGGFTGQVTVYSFSKGVIKKGKGRTSITYSVSIPHKKKEFKKISAKAIAIYKTKESFSHPSNTYHFLQVYSKGKAIKYTWGDPSFLLPSDIENLYNQLIFIIDNLTFNQQ